MSIHIEVPFDSLMRPGVAKALASLVIALGGDSEPVAAPAAAPAAPAAAKAPAPAAKPAPTAKAALDVAAPKAKAKAKAKRAKPSRGKAKPRATADDPSKSIAERWAAYAGRLPETSQRFLSLLEERGRLTVSEAVDALGLSGPKAMGGLTGAMQRWSPVALPFTPQNTMQGERCWKWEGAPEG